METFLYVCVGLAAIALGCCIGLGLWWLTEGRYYR